MGEYATSRPRVWQQVPRKASAIPPLGRWSICRQKPRPLDLTLASVLVGCLPVLGVWWSVVVVAADGREFASTASRQTLNHPRMGRRRGTRSSDVDPRVAPN